METRDDGLLRVSTENAEYLLHAGAHRQPTRIDSDTLRGIDGLVLESSMMQYDDLSLADLRNHQQYAAILPAAMENTTDIFVVDAPYTRSDTRTFLGASSVIGMPCIAGLLGVAHGLPELGLLAVPALAFCAGGTVPHLPAAAVSYAQFSNAYNSLGFRSAVAAMKLEQWVAPLLADRSGTTPTVLIDYGAGHLDIAAYLRHPRIRDVAVAYGKRVLSRTVEADELRTGCRFRYDEDRERYAKTVHERTF